MIIRHPGRSRNGFTLVEMLLVIAIIGILIGMLSMAVIPALKRAKESAVVLELKQLEMSFEQFKNQYGFYPPSFDTFPAGLAGANALRPYINRISPNHLENNPSGVGTLTRLQFWWVEVGQYLDQESSLVFWLSGVCKNKQFPLTGGLDSSGWTTGVPPLAAHSFNFVNDGVERDVFFDFKTAQVVGDATVQKGLVPIPNNQVGFIAEYRQPHSLVEGDQFTSPSYDLNGDPDPTPVVGYTDYRYKYRDSKSYDLGSGNRAYYNGPIDGSILASVNTGQYANPSSFQLITFGLDGLPGTPGNWNSINAGKQSIGPNNFFGPWGADNLCNFSEGRLEKWVVDNQ